MLVGIHQPEHLPWMGYFHKIHMVDTFVILDNVQFKKNYFENRNRLITPQGLSWITAKVEVKGHTSKVFSEMKLLKDWKRKYIKTIEQNYSNAPYHGDIQGVIKEIKNFNDYFLLDLNLLIISSICNLLNIDTKIIHASKIHATGKKTMLVKNILEKTSAYSYLVGKSGYNYLDKDLLENFVLVDHTFNHPNYTPFNNPEFHSYPSIIDVIANIGLSKTENILKSCG